MNYLIIKDNIIENIIVSEKDYAEKMGLLPCYEGATIGALYDPPTLDKLQDEIKNLKSLQSDTDNIIVDQEYRLTLLELSIVE